MSTAIVCLHTVRIVYRDLVLLAWQPCSCNTTLCHGKQSLSATSESAWGNSPVFPPRFASLRPGCFPQLVKSREINQAAPEYFYCCLPHCNVCFCFPVCMEVMACWHYHTLSATFRCASAWHAAGLYAGMYARACAACSVRNLLCALLNCKVAVCKESSCCFNVHEQSCLSSERILFPTTLPHSCFLLNSLSK